MRLFIAIELPKSFKAELSRIRKEVALLSTDGRFVNESNFHLTLHFIGESKNLVGATSAMREAVRGINSFTLHLGKYSCFEKGRNKTSHVAVLGDLKELNALYESLQSALADEGFSRENKRFTPHITLGRNVEHDELVTQELKALSPNASMMVSSITLFESIRNEKQMVYNALHRERF